MIEYPDTNWKAQEQAYQDDLEREQWEQSQREDTVKCACCGTPIEDNEEGLCEECLCEECLYDMECSK